MAWHCKPTGWGYAQGSVEADENALEICNILRARGWSDNAIAGVLGNMQHEGVMNPWQWEGDTPLASTDIWDIEHAAKGYGLTQFTPSGKYINSPYAQATAGYGPKFSDTQGSTLDGASQVVFVDEHADYYPTSYFPISYAQFKVFTGTPAQAAEIWWRNYERSAAPTFPTIRATSADYYYNLITGSPYIDDDVPMYGFFLMKKRRRRGFFI